jgi:hypothetical protein
MKIGTYNIFTSFWFLILFLCGGMLTYISINRNVFGSDLIFIAKFFVALFALISIGILFFFLYKFRILIVDKNKIISIYPFLFKKEIINLAQIKKLKLESFSAFKGTVYRKIKISDLSGTMEISDLEFENFDKLISGLKLNQHRKTEIDLEQATSNLSNVNFNVYLLAGFLIFLVFNIIWNSGFHFIVIAFFICNVILLYAAFKRKLEYKRRMKKAA